LLGGLETRFVTLRVPPSHGFVHGQLPHKEVWLLIAWPGSEKEPMKYFLGDLPANYKLRRLVRLAKCRWKVERDYQQLKRELGLDHYGGEAGPAGTITRRRSCWLMHF
jgi:SRSO17 transposase